MFSDLQRAFSGVGQGNFDLVLVLSIALFALIALSLVFLMVREWVCWYLKIDERILLQNRTNELLETIVSEIDGTTFSGNTGKKSGPKGSAQKDSPAELVVPNPEKGNKVITINL